MRHEILKLECEDCGRSLRLPVDDAHEPPAHRCLGGEVKPFPAVTKHGRANSYWFNHLLD